ncbi:MAG: hypothetical protein RMK52_07685 [Chitinophagales bacterium]|nr:hypothetical protein [Chitinophagales bacterium]MDW8394109.1 hypothetical protein [Chitinophagales bacterium]
MTKVLILCYFFPPANLAASRRLHSWAMYLYDSGIYPIIITRSWNVSFSNAYELLQPDTRQIIHRKYDQYEVYYMPYRGSLRDRLLTRYGPDRLVLLRRSLTFLEHFMQNFTLRFLPYYNLYQQAQKVLRSDPSIRLIVASAMPFSLFGMCHRLSRKFKIPWVADYRDDWNTTSWKTNYSEQSFLRGALSLPERILKFFEKRSERRWLSSAVLFTSVSRYYVWKISNFILRPGKVVYNGYEDLSAASEPVPFDGELRITYSGNLYFTQDISVFAQGLSLFLHQQRDARIALQFIGTGYDPKQVARLEGLFGSMPVRLLITPWLSDEEARRYLAGSHVLLAVANAGFKGAISSKAFVYLSYKKPILLCPSDNDELEALLLPSGLATKAQTPQQAAAFLQQCMNCLNQGLSIASAANEAFIAQFSREQQAKKMGAILNSVLA